MAGRANALCRRWRKSSPADADGPPMLSRIMCWLRTVRYLRPVQIIGRLWYRAYRPVPDLSPAPAMRSVLGPWCEPASRKASLLSPWTFRILNVEHELAGPEDWNDPDHDTLWLYNLHYFDDLNAENAAARGDWHQEVLRRWVAENPPARGAGWEPYPTSLRIVNWIKWSLRGNALSDECLHSLAVQVRWLWRRLEVHLLGNHLFSNAKALAFAGLYFEDMEAESWYRKGMRILAREVPEQVLPDGGHFERSPMYHRIALEDLLDLVNLHRAYGRQAPSSWWEAVGRMLRWAALMRHPDDEVPFFNDAAFGVAPSWDELRAYARRLDFPGVEANEPPAGPFLLPDTGYAGIHGPEATLFFDVAPVGPDYLPGHAHADTLSLELSLFGARVLVNSGTSTYADGDERLRQRGTAAHNAIMIDGEDSSEVWRSFRVARRARVHEVAFDVEQAKMGASHDGFRRLHGNPVHDRRLRAEERALEVTDTLSGGGTHRVEGFWHLHPSVQVRKSGTGSANDLDLEVASSDSIHRATLSIEGPVAVVLEPTTWHPAFGQSLPSRRIRYSYEGTLPLRVVTRIAW